jgi:soluble lytic murein transglycosylase-like protein
VAYRPLAHWTAGLAAWRLKRYDEARTHFEAVARLPNVSPWNVAAAAYWASRVHLVSRRPELVNYWLGTAAEHPRTFYGLLARRALGLDTRFSFEADPLTDADVQLLTGIPGGLRAMALLQIGQTVRAEAEMRAIAGRGVPGLAQAVIGLADLGNMPTLSMQLGGALSDQDGRQHDHALYPLPRWTPSNGFTIDRALIYAFMKQESMFVSDAQNPSGAVGLMQLMPATARAMAPRVSMRLRGTQDLTDPVVNLTLGQEYLNHLLSLDRIDGNLVLTAAAYNSGPGTLYRWQERVEYRKDPLLFIESLPSRETRVFVERVMANYWIYRARLDQPTPDLDQLAAGDWPIYTAMEAGAAALRRTAERDTATSSVR